MSKRFLKIVPETFETESRDMRELNGVKKLDYDIHVLARQSNEKDLPYELKNELYSLRRFDVDVKRSKFILAKAINMLKRVLSWRKTVVKLGLEIDPDIISAHDLISLWMGYKLKKKIERKNKKVCKLVYDSHELTTERAGFRQSKWIYRQITEHNERKYIKKADAVMVVCDSIADFNQKKYKLKTRPYVVRNIPEVKPITSTYNYFREKLNIGEDKKILLYQGGFFKGRGIENMIKALSVLDNKFVFVMMGFTEEAFNKTYYEFAKQCGVSERVYYLPAVAQDVLQEYSNSADIGISLIENYCLSYYYCLPNKLFEYMHANLPILASDFPEMGKIIKDYDIGECVQYDNIAQIAEKINKMIEPENYRRYKKNMQKAQMDANWEKEEQKLIKMYLDLEEKDKNE